ncbi:hypothetical protein D9758_004601 [Tetrapyrgos nigripes]|uniref:glutaminase n=1 Tax=Tetrapyrgos nigripes TaxID=182062 RepID=A0A8H5GZZ7_9AGAR|nr:hypothetical protein D9758_004601 [Tetrapyrgos nigripes]
MLNGTGYASSVTIGILVGRTDLSRSSSFASRCHLPPSPSLILLPSFVRCPSAALQGAFAEYQTALEKLHLRDVGVKVRVVLVRTNEDLDICHALIIPGGESTTISIDAQRSGLFQPLKDFIHIQRKPVWGTCADGRTRVVGWDGGGGWEEWVGVAVSGLRDSETPFIGMFICAPVILSFDQPSQPSPSFSPSPLSSSPPPPPIRIIARLSPDAVLHASGLPLPLPQPVPVPTPSTSSSASPSIPNSHPDADAGPDPY